MMLPPGRQWAREVFLSELSANAATGDHPQSDTPSGSAMSSNSGSSSPPEQPRSRADRHSSSDDTRETRIKIFQAATFLLENGSMYIRIKKAIANMGMVVNMLDYGYEYWRSQPFAGEILHTMETTPRLIAELDVLRNSMLEMEFILHSTFIALMELSRQQQEMRPRTRSASPVGELQSHLPFELTDESLTNAVYQVSIIMRSVQQFS